MVTLNIIVEGQSETSGMSAKVASNAAALRQALNEFFSKVLDTDDIQVAIFMGNGYRNAARMFARRTSVDYECLYVDSDLPYEKRMQWFDTLINKANPEKSIVIPEDRIEKVFFMVQEMEAWFLKQPDCIERWREEEELTRKHTEESIANHSLVRGKDIESIAKPSEKLAILIKKYIYRGKKSVAYGKLQTAPALISHLDTDLLLLKDRELQRFKNTFSTTSKTHCRSGKPAN